jgi:hypothetical protein
MVGEHRHGFSLKDHMKTADLIKTMLTNLVSTRETPEIMVREHLLLGVVLLGRG